MSNISVVGSKDGPVVDERELDTHLDSKGLAPLPAYLAQTALNTAYTGETPLPTRLSASQLNATYAPTIGSPSYAPPGGAFQDIIGRIRTGIQDMSVLVISDSTSASTGSWCDLLIGRLHTLFPQINISYRKYVDGTPGSYATAVVTTGTGSRTLNLWNGSIAGKQWAYSLMNTRPKVLIGDTRPDLIIFSHGHNENNTSTAYYQLRDRAVTSIERARMHAPGAAVVIMSQNPLLAYPGYSEQRADIYRRIAQERGYGFIDVNQAFNGDGRPMTDLVSGDNIHPTAAGYTLWMETVAKHFTTTAISQPAPLSLPTLSLTRRNLLTNGDLEDFASPPALPSVTATNATLAKDTTNFESKAYSLNIAKTAAGSISQIEWVPNSKLLVGKEVTFAVRMRIPTGAAGTVGQLSIVDGVTSPNLSSTTWGDFRDEWFWISMTARIADTAAVGAVKCRIIADPTTGATLVNVSVDRAILVLGRYPMDVY